MLSKVQMILMVAAAIYLYQQHGVPPTYIGAAAVAFIITSFVVQLLKTLVSKGALYGGITLLVSQLTGLTLEFSLYLVVAAFLTVLIFNYMRRR